MSNVFVLTITAQHDFNRTVHRSVHSSYHRAYIHQHDVALPALRAQEDEEWHDCFHTDITIMPLDPT